MAEPTVSVLMRTKNEERYIDETLSALFSQTYEQFEVLVVDSGSTDKTLEIVGKYPVRIFHLSPESFTFGYALNFGIVRSRGEYIVCLSAHALPASGDWIKRAVTCFQDTRVAAVMMQTLPRPDCNPFDRRGLIRKYGRAKGDISEGPPFFFSNANSVIRKTVWEKVPFDEHLPASEDLDWQLKVVQRNFTIIYDPDIQVFHSHNESLRQIYTRYHREERSFRLLHFKAYPLWRILYDLIAGTVYDVLYVLYKREHVKWVFFAFPRRCAMNYGRIRALLGP